MTKILFVFIGGARTFLQNFENLFENIIVPFSENCEICDVYYYIKNFDPGPKLQIGWNYSYNNVDKNELINKINSKPNIGYNIIEEDVPDITLYKQIKNRNNFTGFFNEETEKDIEYKNNDSTENHIYYHLTRSMQMHLNFKNVYDFITNHENKMKNKYDIVFYLRPDLFFNDKIFNYKNFSSKNITTDSGNHIDRWAIIPRNLLESYLNKPYTTYFKNNECIFNCAEEILHECIKNKYIKIHINNCIIR